MWSRAGHIALEAASYLELVEAPWGFELAIGTWFCSVVIYRFLIA